MRRSGARRRPPRPRSRRRGAGRAIVGLDALARAGLDAAKPASQRAGPVRVAASAGAQVDLDDLAAGPGARCCVTRTVTVVAACASSDLVRPVGVAEAVPEGVRGARRCPLPGPVADEHALGVGEFAVGRGDLGDRGVRERARARWWAAGRRARRRRVRTSASAAPALLAGEPAEQHRGDLLAPRQLHRGAGVDDHDGVRVGGGDRRAPARPGGRAAAGRVRSKPSDSTRSVVATTTTAVSAARAAATASAISSSGSRCGLGWPSAKLTTCDAGAVGRVGDHVGQRDLDGLARRRARPRPRSHRGAEERLERVVARPVPGRRRSSVVPSTVRVKAPRPLVPKVCAPLSRGVKVPVSSTVCSVVVGDALGEVAAHPLDLAARQRSPCRGPCRRRRGRRRAASNPLSATASSSFGVGADGVASAVPSGRAAVRPSSGETTCVGEDRGGAAAEDAGVAGGGADEGDGAAGGSSGRTARRASVADQDEGAAGDLAGQRVAVDRGGELGERRRAAPSRMPTRAARRRTLRTASSTSASATSPSRTASASALAVDGRAGRAWRRRGRPSMAPTVERAAIQSETLKPSKPHSPRRTSLTQVAVLGHRGAVDRVVGGHDAPGVGVLDDGLEGGQVELAQGALGDHVVDGEAVGLGVVGDEVLDGGADAAVLDAASRSRCRSRR